MVALRRAGMGVVRWMCGVELRDGLLGGELRERLGVDDVASVLQQNGLWWYGHVLQKDDGDWVKKCMKCEVRGPGGGLGRGFPGGLSARRVNKEGAVDRCGWRKMVEDVRWSGWV